uniref:N-acetyltransferase domain-containing protein n=1 Tax=Mycena chlorophos TaxID=658473 RepID=A0ABQ0KYF9_MYCCL|nr:predicted protein [Mycena chlorophos]
MPSAITVLRRPTGDQIEKLVQLCLRTYNPSEISVKTLAGGDTTRLTLFFSASLRCAALGGEIHVVTEEGDMNGQFRGVAVWWQPGVEPFSSAEQQAILDEFVSQLTPEAREWHRTTYRMEFAELTEKALGPGGKLNSWWLSILAVEPEYQRRGTARALVEAVQNKANGSLLSVAATNELNVAIYKQLGFEVRGQMVMQSHLDGDFPVFVLAVRK